ncbi:hypothetical protein [Parasediminibacterium sp. JCM 36343]|uniref:hypothetical protein n=1 Tax=Parasediminibacterium sp. JCM 36343 TaxID=3374279 RepID=UPI0039788DA8
MSAIGEGLVYFIYFILGFGCIIYLLLALTSNKKTKLWAFPLILFFGYLFFLYKSYLLESYNQMQFNDVGIYYLTNYPNCPSCYLELKENMTYTVMDSCKIVESSNWHSEAGGDYFITY